MEFRTSRSSFVLFSIYFAKLILLNFCWSVNIVLGFVLLQSYRNPFQFVTSNWTNLLWKNFFRVQKYFGLFVTDLLINLLGHIWTIFPNYLLLYQGIYIKCWQLYIFDGTTCIYLKIRYSHKHTYSCPRNSTFRKY